MRFSKYNVNNRSVKNAGFTLIEIIVVVAIIAIATAIGGLSINAVFTFDMKKGVQNINGALEKVKVEQMAKAGDSWLKLYADDDGIYLDIYENGIRLDNEFDDGNKIAKKTVSVTYTLSDATEHTLDGTGIVLAFNRSDGSFATADDALTRSGTQGTIGTGVYYSSITLKSGDRSRTLTLYPNTGKFDISQ